MILVINAGSSSIKFTLFRLPELKVVGHGQVERIGTSGQAAFDFRWPGEEGTQTVKTELRAPDHQTAFQYIAAQLKDTVLERTEDLKAIGHRVVHGGERFSNPAVLTEEVRSVIRELFPLAPLHNPPNLLGIEISAEVFPQALQVGVFDTAFHQTIPEYAFRYALPDAYYRDFGVRKYGFHGTSHCYITETCQEHFGKQEVNLIIAHLGNGASMTAVQEGRSVDNSLGLSPLPGLIMGTRSGDIDPSIIFHLARQGGYSLEKLETELNKGSGLKGLTGNSDLREIQAREAAGDPEAALALRMYAYRIRQYIGSYLAVLGRVDALVFTAGVGEHSSEVRARVLQGLSGLGLRLDPEKNRDPGSEPVRDITAADGPIRILVIPTDEEKQIAREVVRVLQRAGR